MQDDSLIGEAVPAFIKTAVKGRGYDFFIKTAVKGRGYDFI